jgi:glucokinase
MPKRAAPGGPPASLALGIAVSGHTVRAVVVDEAGEVQARAQRLASGEGFVAALREAARVAAREAGAAPGAVGFATADPAASGASAALQVLRADHPACTIHDMGAACAVAEAWCGAARGSRHVVSLTIGDEITAGILVDGHPWTGAHGLAGSAAWLALNPVERQDYRKFGCLDAEVSARGIARRLVWRIQAGDTSAVLERAGDLEAITASHVFEGARTRDGVAISVVRDTAKYVGMAVANLAAAIDPEIVVLGGLVAAAGDLLLEPVRQEALRRIPPAMAELFRLEMSSLGEDAAAIGAARLAALAR